MLKLKKTAQRNTVTIFIWHLTTEQKKTITTSDYKNAQTSAFSSNVHTKWLFGVKARITHKHTTRQKKCVSKTTRRIEWLEQRTHTKQNWKEGEKNLCGSLTFDLQVSHLFRFRLLYIRISFQSKALRSKYVCAGRHTKSLKCEVNKQTRCDHSRKKQQNRKKIFLFGDNNCSVVHTQWIREHNKTIEVITPTKKHCDLFLLSFLLSLSFSLGMCLCEKTEKKHGQKKNAWLPMKWFCFILNVVIQCCSPPSRYSVLLLVSLHWLFAYRYISDEQKKARYTRKKSKCVSVCLVQVRLLCERVIQ